MDELGEYQEQLLHARQRLILKGQLYSTPEDSLHQAAQIIEQVCDPIVLPGTALHAYVSMYVHVGIIIF